MKNKEDISDVIKIFESNSFEETNKYLCIGWVLLGVFSIQYSENGYCANYSIGWLKANGNIKYPEKEKETVTENLELGEDPFSDQLPY